MYETTLKKEAAKQAERQAQVRQDSRGAAKATRRPKTNRREIKYTADGERSSKNLNTKPGYEKFTSFQLWVNARRGTKILITFSGTSQISINLMTHQVSLKMIQPGL